MNSMVTKWWVRRLLMGLLLLSVAGGLGAKVFWRSLTPQQFKRKTTLRISEKNRTYYVLEGGTEITVSISGPTKLRILSRIEIPSSKKESRYTYLVRRDDGEWVKFTRRGVASMQAHVARSNSKKVSLGEKHILKVPAGSHTYSFQLPKESSPSVFLRFHQEEGDIGAPTNMVAITPQVTSEAIDLVIHEEVTTYYRLGEGNEIALRLIGPATLKALARLEFYPDMRGQQDFRVQVFEDGLIKGTYSLMTVESDVCQYQQTSSLVPGKAETFYLEIPKGEHDYRFVLPDSYRSVLLKLLLPKKNLSGKP